MSVIFIGPQNDPITGQSLAFSLIYDNYKENKSIIEYGGRNTIFKIMSIVICSIKLFMLGVTFKYDSVYITTSRTVFGFIRDFLLINISKLFSLKVVNHLHGADFKNFYFSLNPIMKELVNYTYKKIDTSIVLLPRMKEQYDMFENMNIVCISNCCDTPLYTPNFEKKKKNTILYLSNVMFSKGIVHLIDAVIKLHDEGVDVELNIAGSILGDDFKSKDEMESILFNKILNKKYIEYVGVVKGKCKDKLLHESMLFVLPTFYKTEAQPISIIEAIANGCVVITTNHNYLMDMISLRNGCIIEKQCVSSIYDAISVYLKSIEKAKVVFDHNVKIAGDKYSLDKYVLKISSELYRV